MLIIFISIFLFHESMAMVVDDIVRVRIAGMQRPVYLPPDLISKADDHRTYVQIAKAMSEINRLLNQPFFGERSRQAKAEIHIVRRNFSSNT